MFDFGHIQYTKKCIKSVVIYFCQVKREPSFKRYRYTVATWYAFELKVKYSFIFVCFKKLHYLYLNILPFSDRCTSIYTMFDQIIDKV